MKSVAFMCLFLLTLFMVGCGSNSGNSSKPNQQRQAQISQEDQERRQQDAKVEQQRKAAEEQRRTEEMKRQQEANNSKQQAQNIAMQFTTAFFKEDLESMQGITYCSDESIETSLQISAMKLCRSRILGYLRYKMGKQGVNDFEYQWTVTLTDYMDTLAYYKFDVSINGTVYLIVENISMSKGKDGKWYVDMTSFVNQSGYAMDVKDRMRDFE